MKKYIKIGFSMAIINLSYTLSAQKIDTLFTKSNIDYITYIGLVGKNNLEYSAEKFKIKMAEANILSARVFPDPEFGFSFTDNGQRRMNMGYGFGSELSWTLELGGKRKARIEMAQNEAKLTRILLEDYFRKLRSDATLAYLTGIYNRYLLDVKLNSYQQMKKLAEADSIRFKLGAIAQVNARQSKLEAGTILSEVYAAQAELKSSLVNLSLFSGQRQRSSLFYPKEGFKGFDRNFLLQELIIIAQNNRTDLKIALQNKNISQNIIKLSKANRALDLGLSLSVSYNSYVKNVIAPTPSFTAVNAGISIPLKFSNNRSGELRASEYGKIQAEVLYEQTALNIEAEVTQAFYNYKSAQKQLALFNTGLLAEAKAILNGKIYSYKRGETSLLEVLEAHRTYNEVQQNYYQSLYQHAVALVELEKAAGIWDINF
ncbi:TolC family protein [Elizabethkingia argentiflava]|uniref:TolC family protein n=1 Tax=Elizabethkingia argenteiflava TaxID=2681556 RepID=A0A845PTX6_9FLAO|nr:TolC family protein [Elizabethkingia argenteiflava]NAW51095.1 TolC family protein [Elizabethkingia argenteiflava]